MAYPVIGHVTLGIYAALLAVGGVMGFVKARSHASLISGLIAAVFAVIALWLAWIDNPIGFPLGVVLAIAMFILFGYRYSIRSKKFMPSGLLAAISLVVLLVLLLVADWNP
jgi:uncharacterized membrane protein (UPF0136 family)